MRLFLSDLEPFSNLQHLLHFDCDTLLINSLNLTSIWREMDLRQYTMGMAPESIEGGWYQEKENEYSFDFVPPLGINSGDSFFFFKGVKMFS